MELKPFERKKEDLEKSTFNRTFMELKQIYTERTGQSRETFNRTFMELKRLSINSTYVIFLLLIAPLWN